MKTVLKLFFNFGPATFTTFIALFYLVKDWESFKRPLLRWSVLLLLFLSWIFGIYKTLEDQEQKAGMKSSEETAKKNQEENTKQFLNSIANLSQKLSDLQGDVKTAGLQEKYEKLKVELESTQKALNPPKATLTYSFGNPHDIDKPLLRKITLPVKKDIVHVEFTCMNTSNVNARNGLFILKICERCEFASEPVGFTKIKGHPTQRLMKFENVFAKTGSQAMEADIKVPSDSSWVEFGVSYGCENCTIADPKAYTGIINLSR